MPGLQLDRYRHKTLQNFIIRTKAISGIEKIIIHKQIYTASLIAQRKTVPPYRNLNRLTGSILKNELARKPLCRTVIPHVPYFKSKTHIENKRSLSILPDDPSQRWRRYCQRMILVSQSISCKYFG
ncbi:hypothetical protein AC781_07960 [Akkermansia glycaniphila]|nr:hypothetical protein AC781_07960 [Akkermansia glycaniphila]